jgi:hypothetical protein
MLLIYQPLLLAQVQMALLSRANQGMNGIGVVFFAEHNI